MTTQERSPDLSPEDEEEEEHYDSEDEQYPDEGPRQLRTSHSASSISSTSSSTTNQTFLSTLSFGTTSEHLRTQTQDELLSSSSSISLAGSVRRGYRDKHPQSEDQDELVDIDSLDVAILTPRDNNRPNPFDGSFFSTRHGQQPPQLYDTQADGNTSSSSSSNSQNFPSGARRKGHSKSFSQLSSSVVTIKDGVMGRGALDQYSPERPISMNGRHSSEKSTDDQLLQVQTEEGMQYTSPDYRKSMVASIHSDDIAMDFSNGASPISGRGSFYPEQHQKHQYGNLLQEAASIIEQQYQGRIETGSRTSMDEVASPMRSTHESGYEAIAAMAPSRPNSGRTVYRTVQEVPAQPQPTQPPLPPEAPVSEAPS